MKTLSKLFLAVTCASALFACTDELETRIATLESRVDELSEQVSAINENVAALSAIAQQKTISSYTEKDGTYTLILSDNSKIVLHQGGSGKDGKTPVICIDEEGYWMVDNQDGNGAQYLIVNNQKVSAKGVTPVLGINADGNWTISYDGGATATEIKDADGNPVKAQGEDGDSFFKSVECADGFLTITLANEMSYKLPIADGFIFAIKDFEPLLLFMSEETKTFEIEQQNVAEFTAACPTGYEVWIEGNVLNIKAPVKAPTKASLDTRSEIAITAVSTNGFTAVQKCTVAWAVLFDKNLWNAGDASALVDDDLSTSWKAAAAGEASAVIEMAKAIDVKGISIYQAAGNYMRNFKVEYSLDGTAYELGCEGTLKTTTFRQDFDFAAEAKAQYIRITVLTTETEGALAELAEIDLYNKYLTSGDNGTVMPALKNSTTPFSSDGTDLFPAVGAGRFAKVTDWIHDNMYISLDTANGNLFGFWGAPAWGCGLPNNGKVYQKFDFVPGIYRFAAKSHSATFPDCVTAYSVVAKDAIPNIEDINEATVIGSADVMGTIGDVGIIDFTVTEPCTIVVGIVATFQNSYPNAYGAPWTDLYFDWFALDAK